jgi:ribosomal protein S27E
MSHVLPCITNVLPDVPSCTYRDEHLLTCTGYTDSGKPCRGCEPRAATHGEVCDRCYDRVDHAIRAADHLRTALHGVDRAIAVEGGTQIAGPRVPLTAILLAFDEIDRAHDGRYDVDEWVATEEGAVQAVRFAKYVHAADRAHPTAERERKLHRLRCPDCGRNTATWQPPDWYGDDVHITCLSCGWTATNPDAIDIVTQIETRGVA